MSNASSFERPPTAQEAVLAAVRRSLLDGTLAPGTRINVDRMATELNVSRAPLRDALRILEGEGQVEYRPHRGYAVPELDPVDLFEIYRIRELLETEAILLGAANIDDAVIAEMEAAAREATEAVENGDNIAGTYANRRFHYALLESCRSKRLMTMIRGLYNSDGYRTFYFADPEMTNESDQEHYKIIEAAKRRDAGKLVALCNHHRNHALTMVLTVLDRRGELPFDEFPDESSWRPVLTTGRTAAT